MKILITGAAGGIGSTLGYHLNLKGHDLILVDNLRNGYIENLTVDGNKFGDFYEIDINSDEFHKLVQEKSPEVILHLAAITSLPECEINYRECIRCNVEGTASVIGAARNAGIDKIIFASTSAVYENTDLNVDGFLETDPVDPRLFYSLSKKMSEDICKSFIENYGMNIVILRFFNVFGPRQDIHRKSPPLINYIVMEIKNNRIPILHSNGSQSRDYVYVDDVIDLIEKCLELEGSHTFNVSTNTLTSVIDILSGIERGLDIQGQIKPVYNNPEKLWDSYDELFRGKFPLKKNIVQRETLKKSLGNNSYAKNKLNWYPNTSIKEIIESVVSNIKL